MVSPGGRLKLGGPSTQTDPEGARSRRARSSPKTLSAKRQWRPGLNQEGLGLPALRVYEVPGRLPVSHTNPLPVEGWGLQ